MSLKIRLKYAPKMNKIEHKVAIAIIQELVDDIVKDMIVKDLDDENLLNILSNELGIHIGRVKKDFFIEALGAPGENNAGYGVYYDSSTQTSYLIFRNGDDYLYPTCSKLKPTVRKFNDWKQKYRTDDGMFIVDYSSNRSGLSR